MKGSNPFSDDRRQTAQIARREIERTSTGQAPVAISSTAAVRAGTFDADGNLQTYGKLGITKIGAGFRIRGY